MYNRNIRKFARELEKIAPSSAGNDLVKRNILASIESLGLDHDYITLVGSAALKMYDIEVSAPTDSERTKYKLDRLGIGQQKPRLGDVDLVVPPSYLQQLSSVGETPYGIPIRLPEEKPHRNRTILRATYPEQSGFMPVDLITPYTGDWSPRDISRYEKRYSRFHSRHDRMIPGTNLRILSLGQIALELARNSSDTQAESDLEVIKHRFRTS